MKVLGDMDFQGKRVLLRVDYNVAIESGRVANDNKLRQSIPTIEYLLNKGSKIILVTHIGRPDGEAKEELRTHTVAARLGQLMGLNVKESTATIDKANQDVGRLQPGEIIMLENIRFYPEEEKNDMEFAKKLASLADVYVNDAFAVSHRDNASVCAITRFLPSCAGLLLEKEVNALSGLLENPAKPFVLAIGGAKLETKIPVIENMAKKADKIILGGAMIFPFYRAKGFGTGKSLMSEKEVALAKNLLEMHAGKIILPTDVVLDNGEEAECNQIPNDRAGLDIGHRSIELFRYALREAKTVVWNGPLGKFEDKRFAKGTYELARIISALKATTVVGGGETVAAVEDLGLMDKFTHVSTGGGAALEFLEGKKLPGIIALG
jgi:phosphoglycerate kinase